MGDEVHDAVLVGAGAHPRRRQPRPSGMSNGDRRRLLLILSGLSAFGPLTTDVYLPGLPDIGRSLGVSASGVQLTLTACVTGLAVGQVIAGPLSDALGRRRPLQVGLVLFVLASLGCAVAPTIALLCLARLAQGLAGAAGIVIARAMVRDMFSGAEAASFFSALSAVVATGPIFAPVLGGLLLRVTGWRGIFVVLAGSGALLLAGATYGTRETLPEPLRRSGGLGEATRTFGGLLADPRYIAYALPGALAFGALFAYISASSFVYQGVLGVGPQLYGVLFAVNGVGLVCASVFNGRLAGRGQAARMLVIGLVALTAGSAAVAAATLGAAGLGVMVALLFATVASMGLVLPNAIALSLAEQARRAGSASALFGLLQFTVAALVAPAVGVAGVSAVPMGVGMLVMAVSALTAHLLLRRSRQREPALAPR